MSDTKTIVLKQKKRQSKIGKGSRKIGRSLVKCANYKTRGQREKNKKRKAKKEAKFRAKKAAKKLRRP